jgi:hypothetical protein
MLTTEQACVLTCCAIVLLLCVGWMVRRGLWLEDRNQWRGRRLDRCRRRLLAAREERDWWLLGYDEIRYEKHPR